MPKASSVSSDAISSTDSRTAASPTPVPFEQAIEELEKIVLRMEDGSLSLDQSLAAYRRGAELVKVCENALEHAREQVRVLDGELLRPLSEMATRA
jgi:exodeoxyribonuclease VII small subunit